MPSHILRGSVELRVNMCLAIMCENRNSWDGKLLLAITKEVTSTLEKKGGRIITKEKQEKLLLPKTKKTHKSVLGVLKLNNPKRNTLNTILYQLNSPGAT